MFVWDLEFKRSLYALGLKANQFEMITLEKRAACKADRSADIPCGSRRDEE
jgi:hypothetical protein